MPIDYTKRPKAASANSPPAAGQPERTAAPVPPPQSGPVLLTKAAPTVSLTKHAGGMLRVNLNWNVRSESGKVGFMRKFTTGGLDLDLGCLYEFSDGSKGVVQALGRSFTAHAADGTGPVVRLDGDDRSGAVSGGENLFIDLAHVARIRRILVFALIYEGAANWAAAAGVVTLYPASGQPITINLDDPRDGARICAIALLENQAGDLVVRREVNYINGGQRALDEAYGWGMRWTAGRK